MYLGVGIASCGSGLALVVVPKVTEQLIDLGNMGWKNGLFFYAGLYTMAGILVSIFPSQEEMEERQFEIEENMQKSLSLGLTLDIRRLSLGIVLPQFKLADKRIDARRMTQISVDASTLQQLEKTAWDNLHILKHPCFLPFGLCYLNFGLAYQVLFTYFEPMTCKIAIIDKSQSANLLIIMGLTNIVGRIICGCINDYKILNPILWYGLGCLSGGACLIIYPMCNDYVLLAVVSGFYGLCTAMICCNQWLAGLHIFGIQHFSTAMGYLECIGGTATLAGCALLTYISKIHGKGIKYECMMYIAGGVFVVNTLLSLVCFVVRKRSKRVS